MDYHTGEGVVGCWVRAGPAASISMSLSIKAAVGLSEACRKKSIGFFPSHFRASRSIGLSIDPMDDLLRELASEIAGVCVPFAWDELIRWFSGVLSNCQESAMGSTHLILLSEYSRVRHGVRDYGDRVRDNASLVVCESK